MGKVVNKNIVIFSLILVLCLSLFIGYKTLYNKKDIPEKYKTNSERKQFAMFIKNNANNQYETYEGDSFPEGYIANLDKSICTDINDNIIKGVISNSDSGITVTSNKTVYCEIYLDKQLLSDKLINNPIEGVVGPTGEPMDELATRYYGTNPPNYICFGTKDKDTCMGDTDKYMYRIIGIDKQGRYKVIKKEALNTYYRWHSSQIADIKWPQSDLYKNLNGSYFLTNGTYMPSGWIDKIETIAWKYGDIYNADVHTASNKTASQMVQVEQGWSTITSGAKIGLMYLADYYYGLNKTGVNCSYNSSRYSTCKTSWIHISQNDSAPPSSYEWTMSRYGYDNSNSLYRAWNVSSVGGVSLDHLTITLSVRPVFYIVASAEISGTGTITDPYLIVN